MNGTIDKTLLIRELRRSISDLSITEEPNFLENDEALLRFLASREWDVSAAEKMIRKTVEWRAETQPFKLECERCRLNPGSHTLRQIGFDKLNRPVIYATFYSASPAQRNPAVHALQHLIYIFENAVRSMRPGVSQWVFILDCAGMSPTNCSPRLGYECAQVLSNHYPERLGAAICICPGPIFKVALKAIKPFLPQATSNKVHIVNSKSQLRSTFEKYFSSSMVEWLVTEYKLNRAEPKRSRYRPFWLPEIEMAVNHDPRGDKNYVDEWVLNKHPSGHLPHPTIIDHLSGKLQELPECNELDEKSDVADEDDFTNLDEEAAEKLLASLPSKYQIPVETSSR